MFLFFALEDTEESGWTFNQENTLETSKHCHLLCASLKSKFVPAFTHSEEVFRGSGESVDLMIHRELSRKDTMIPRQKNFIKTTFPHINATNKETAKYDGATCLKRWNGNLISVRGVWLIFKNNDLSEVFTYNGLTMNIKTNRSPKVRTEHCGLPLVVAFSPIS